MLMLVGCVGVGGMCGGVSGVCVCCILGGTQHFSDIIKNGKIP